MLPIERACYWMDTCEYEINASLQTDLKCDVAIIGGGFTGLWAALFLKELGPSLEIVLLEKGIVGSGGSGRNAGILGETIDHSHSLAIAHFGFQEAKRLAAIGKQNVAEMISFIQQNRIDCGLEPAGRLLMALTQQQLEDAHRAVESASKLGINDWHLFDRLQMQNEINSPLYLGGIFAPGGGILNPFQLIQGLKSVAMQNGIRVFERTVVRSVQSKYIETDQGRVTAEKTILATDAYTHHLFPKLLRWFIPLYDYILVSEPLTDQQHSEIGWKNRQGVTDGRTFFNYYRLTSDDRILWGTSEAKYYPPNRVEEACDHSESHYEALKQSFARHFPQISNLQFRYAWGGPIASTTRLTPFFGTLEGGKIFYALGYTGHGVGSTRLAAKILAHMVLQKPSELLSLDLVRKKPISFPPEPFRRMAVNSVSAALRKTDEGKKPSVLVRLLDHFGIGFSS